MSDGILVISPHPDDLEIGMGGTVAKMQSSGHQVISLVLTDGRRSPRISPCSDDEMAAIRSKELEEAAELLNLHLLVQLRLHNLFDQNRTAASDAIRATLERYSPVEVYCPHPVLDLHPTHRLGAEILLDTLKHYGFQGYVWAYEVWGLFHAWDRFEDISETISVKLKAINCHQSQVSNKPYDLGIAGLNKWRAVFADPHRVTKAKYAEVFKLL